MDVNRGAEITSHTYTHTHGEKTATVSGLSSRDRVVLSVFWNVVKALEVHWCGWGWLQNHLWHYKAALSYFAPAASHHTFSCLQIWMKGHHGIPYTQTPRFFYHFLPFHWHARMFLSTTGCHYNSSGILVCVHMWLCVYVGHVQNTLLRSLLISEQGLDSAEKL